MINLIKEDYKDLINIALKEDLDSIGDVSSDPIFSIESSSFLLVSKDNGILCGKDVFIEIFKTIDNKIIIEFFYNDGDHIKHGEKIAKLTGKVKSVLKAERTALNFLGHLSGISTKAAMFAKAAGNYTKILDTRKTLPGLRKLQKYAVKCGGGHNHRMGLYDMVMIKDNHQDSAGGIQNAVNKIREAWNSKYKIEVETRNLKEVKEALDCNIDRIMLDNMDLKTIKEAIKIIDGQVEIEISGNITLKKLKKIAKVGVDFVSVGELTHSVKAFDFSLVKE